MAWSRALNPSLLGVFPGRRLRVADVSHRDRASLGGPTCLLPAAALRLAILALRRLLHAARLGALLGHAHDMADSGERASLVSGGQGMDPVSQSPGKEG